MKTWMFTSLVLAVSATILTPSQSAPDADLVTSLPGLKTMPPFKQYSGYLNGDHVDDKHLHYWFVESSSNPTSDPVVLWLNGGPGCSSNMGYLQEHGPYHQYPNGSLYFNAFSWNQVANMIYLESPAGVGYSYANSGKYKTNDSAVAIENAIALQSFFAKFPEYKDNDFYITGESYGGMYIPTLAAQVVEETKINLKGFAVGNGLSNYHDNDNSLLYFTYYHGLIGDGDWTFLTTSCCPENGPSRCNFTKAALTNQECMDKIQSITNLVWNKGIDPYNLYAKCAGGVPGFKTVHRPDEGVYETSYFGWPFSYLDSNKEQMERQRQIPEGKLRANPQCADFTNIIAYMNNPDVIKALHISPKAPKWMPCSDAVGSSYGMLYPSMHPFYEKALKHKLRMLVYNGDVDMACNFLGDEWFVDRLPLKNPGVRRLWFFKADDGTKQVGGFVKTYDNLSLLTVRGSGHLVPQDKPRQALEMFVNFVQDKPYMN